MVYRIRQTVPRRVVYHERGDCEGVVTAGKELVLIFKFNWINAISTQTGDTTVKKLIAISLALSSALAGNAYAESEAAKRAEQMLKPYLTLPKFEAAGPAYDAQKCMAGKKILGLPVSSANPFTKNINMAMGGVGKKVGFTFTEWENQGQPSQWVQGMNYAVNNKYDLIDLLGGPYPHVLAPQLTQATDKGNNVTSAPLHGLDPTTSPPLSPL